MRDFSGHYQLNRRASNLSAAAATYESATIHIDHGEPRFRLHGRFLSPTAPQEYTFECFTDGRETGSGTDTLTMHWDGDALIARFRLGGPDAAFSMTWRYEMSSDARQLTAFEELRGGGRDQANVWVFDRT